MRKWIQEGMEEAAEAEKLSGEKLELIALSAGSRDRYFLKVDSRHYIGWDASPGV
jgi:hypothetical protein